MIARIADHSEYFDDPSSFFANFSSAWDAAVTTVRKLETRQTYREPGNPSWERLVAGDFDKALRLLPEVRQEDVELYESLQKRGIHFLRCRPIVFPLSVYLKWELGCYDFNAAHGEDIRAVEANDVPASLSGALTHDFMTFDTEMAVIHDYDSDGEIQGGWVVRDSVDITTMVRLFDDFARLCIPYEQLLRQNGYDRV